MEENKKQAKPSTLNKYLYKLPGVYNIFLRLKNFSAGFFNETV